MRLVALAAVLALAAGPALAGDTLAGALAPLGFMVGDWRGAGDGTGAGAGGDSTIHPDLDGRVLIRRDHVLTKAGTSFDIYMLIYADQAGLRAQFIDTEGHVIHYLAAPGPGPSVRFESPGSGQAPGFRLTYDAAGADRLHIRFEIAPPGADYRIYSEGDVVRR